MQVLKFYCNAKEPRVEVTYCYGHEGDTLNWNKSVVFNQRDLRDSQNIYWTIWKGDASAEIEAERKQAYLDLRALNKIAPIPALEEKYGNTVPKIP